MCTLPPDASNRKIRQRQIKRGEQITNRARSINSAVIQYDAGDAASPFLVYTYFDAFGSIPNIVYKLFRSSQQMYNTLKNFPPSLLDKHTRTHIDIITIFPVCEANRVLCCLFPCKFHFFLLASHSL